MATNFIALSADYVVVGGGVAGVCLIEELTELLESDEVPGTSTHRIIFITGREGFVKRITNTKRISQIATTFDVESSDPVEYYSNSKRLRLVQDDVRSWDSVNKKLFLRSGGEITYCKLAVATGASPKRLLPPHPCVLRLRDIQTIKDLKEKLQKSKRILIVGNGGIASELAFELNNIEIIWAIRHSSISATYFDIAAAKFFETKLLAGREEDDQKAEVKTDRFTSVIIQNEERNTFEFDKNPAVSHSGSALGPHWLARLAQKSENEQNKRKLHVINEVELTCFNENRPTTNKLIELPEAFLPASVDWPIWACLSNGKLLGCDLIIEATGVEPNTHLWKQSCPNLELADDGGVFVDEHMKTNLENVYAAGDVCTPRWGKDSQHWKQIRLWTQARQMGIYCARAMLIDELLLDISFDLFTHCTSFFGYKVVLLGDFTGEKLEKPFEKNYRITEGVEYVQVLTKDHRVHGAVLIGDTDLEEAIENLILDQTDISQIEGNLLDPNIDLEDFFD